MKKIIKIFLFSITILILLLFASYKFYQYKMERVLFSIDKIVLQKDGSKDINVEIPINPEVDNIFSNAEYAGKFLISKGNHYDGICYFKDGITGSISISQNFGDITIFVSDDYTRCFIFKNGFDELWLNFIKSKIESK